jgi:excisionase family DNA binding protein
MGEIMERQVYSVSEFCQATGIGKTTIFRWIKLGKIDIVRLGGRPFILAHHLAHHKIAAPWRERKLRPLDDVEEQDKQRDQ